VASRKDAEAGWEIFKDSDYAASLGEINEELIRRDLAPVSARTYRHYFKLHRYGYERYLPINQLDVRTLQDPVWDKGMRTRFQLFPVDQPVRVVLLVDGRPVQLDGRAGELSEGEAVITLEGRAAVDAVAAIRGADWGLQVLFTRTGELRLAEAEKVNVDTRRRRVRLTVTFARLRDVDALVERIELAEGQLSITLAGDSAGVLLARTTQDLYWLFQAVESSRLLVAELLSEIDSDGRVRLSPAVVRRLSVASPLEAAILAAGPVLFFLAEVVKRASQARESWWRGTEAREDARAAGSRAKSTEIGIAEAESRAREASAQADAAEERRRQATADADLSELQVDWARRQIEQAEEDRGDALRWEQERRRVLAGLDWDELVTVTIGSLRGELQGMGIQVNLAELEPSTREQVQAILLGQVLPAVAELIEGSDGELHAGAVPDDDPTASADDEGGGFR
jgi:hypothetical protein